MAENRRVELSVTPDAAFAKVSRAFEVIGKLEDANPTTRTVVGKARYGLNPVRLRVSILSAPAGSVLEIAGKGQDVWGAASRKVTDKLLAAIK
jgi:hypothetical protein